MLKEILDEALELLSLTFGEFFFSINTYCINLTLQRRAKNLATSYVDNVSYLKKSAMDQLHSDLLKPSVWDQHIMWW